LAEVKVEPGGNIIDIKHVSKWFGDKQVLDDVSLHIRKGEFVTILGPSGCGKTTLLRILSGFETASEGEILLEGADITQTPPHQRPMNTVFQRYALFPHLNVYDNIAFGLKLKKEKDNIIENKVRRALKMVGMTDYEHRDVNSLSGGQQQRVAIARALINRPQILFADEPTGNLDRANADEVLNLLLRTKEELGCALVMVTHDLTIAARADRVFKMDGGRLRPWSNHRDGILPGYAGGEE
jgi:spermidine/putrescine transport system ATP-binding protein